MIADIGDWLADARTLLAREYRIEGRLTPLAGENRNAFVEGADGRRFVLKLASEDRTSSILHFEDATVEHLIASGVGIALPRTVRTEAGAIEARWQAPGKAALRGRLLAFLSGTAWGERADPSPKLLHDLGRVLATVDLALERFSHPIATRTHRWDLTAVAQHRSKVALVENPTRRRHLEWAFHLWAACAAPRFDRLPRSVIYGDANDENVLVDGDRVIGLLDFGDALENPTVCELAIAIVYAVLGLADPLAGGAHVVAGYHAVRPLGADEIDVLFPLICGRLAASVAIAAERRRIDPTNANWFVTEDRAWRLIELLAGIDPNDARRVLMSQTDVTFAGADALSPSALAAARRRHIGPSLSVAYREPLEIVRGEGQYLYDHRGRPYLDLVNNVCHVGHCHPRVVEAGQRQMARLNTNTRYLNEHLTEYATRLTATLPASLEVCFFVNSGSEANELALRLARTHTGRRDMCIVDGAYHGNTSSLVAMSPYKFMGPGGSGAAEPWVHVVPMPDGYRGIHRGHTKEVGEAYGDDVARVIAGARAPIAGLLVESLLSCGGQIVLPPGYLETAFAHVRAAGGVCIVDEVQVGFGRVGSHFWGFQLQGVVPDIVVMGKPMGNGHPIGAVVTTRAIAASFDNGMEFFSTFGGNPVSCAIGTAVLDVIEDEGLQARAAHLGGRLLDGLRRLAGDHALIGDVRGEGLFVGVELVRDRHTLEPAAKEASNLVNRLKTRGMLLSTDGPLHNVIKIKPPLVLTDDDVDMLLRSLGDELSAAGLASS